MGALVGIWSKEERQTSSLSIHKMADTLKLCEQDKISFFKGKHLSLGYVYQHNQPLHENVWQDDEFYLLFIGDILNLKEIMKTLKRSFSIKVNSQAEILLLFFKQKKKLFSPELNGNFGIIVYNKKSHELTLINDRLGQIRVYYTKIKDKIIFSSKAKAILAHEEVTLKVNESSLLDLFLFRTLMEHESLFENIHLLPPASMWRINKFEFKKSNFWYLEEKLLHPIKYKKKEDCMEQTRILFNQSVQRTLVGDLTFHLGLTAGLDSRSILSAIQPNNSKVSCFTIGNNDNPEVIIAKELANIYGLKHEQKKIEHTSAEVFIKNLKKSVYLSEGLSNLEAGIHLDACIEQREYSTQIRQITGTLGTQNMRVPLFFAGKPYFFSRLENAIIGKIPIPHNVLTPLLDQMFNYTIKLYIGIPKPAQFFTNRYLEMAKDRFHTMNHRNYQEADKLGFTTIGGKLYYIALKHLIQNCFPSRNPLSEKYQRTPFIDNDFFEHIVQVPLSMKSELKMDLHRYIIKKNNPLLTSVPYYNKAGIASFNKASLKEWKNKIRKNIPKTILFELGHRIRTDLKEFTIDLLLNGDIWCSNFFNKKYINSLVQGHIDGKISATYTISNLIIFELWYKIFFTSSKEK